jgi:hypothetical protein
MFYALLLQMENHAHATLTDTPFKGLVMTSERPPMWNGVYPNFIPNEVNFVALCFNFLICNQIHVIKYLNFTMSSISFVKPSMFLWPSEPNPWCKVKWTERLQGTNLCSTFAF